MSGARHARRNKRVRRLWTTMLVALSLVGCSVPVTAHACSIQQDRHIAAGLRVAHSLEHRNVEGTDDVLRTLGRARRRCSAAAYARGLATVLRREGAPRVGQRTRWRSFTYVGIRADDRVVWRFDTVRAFRSLPHNSHRLARYRSLRALVGFGTTRRVWSIDPVRAQPRIDVQIEVLRMLRLRAIPAREQQYTIAGMRYGPIARELRRSPLQVAASRSLALYRAIGTSSRQSMVREARRTTAAVAQRLRSAPRRGWMFVDGRWSTVQEHRRLVRSISDLAALRNDAALGTTAMRVRAQLSASPHVRFITLPGNGFYPWPSDGSFDLDHAAIDINKPAIIETDIYASAGGLVRRMSSSGDPGTIDIAWDGRSSAGALQPPGSYTYTVIARDGLANTSVVAGVGAFTILRDQRPPAIVSARLRYVAGSRRRTFRAAWNIDEQVSPRITVDLILISAHQRITLHVANPALSGRRIISRRVPSGTWRSVIRVSDGSGNRSTRHLGSINLP